VLWHSGALYDGGRSFPDRRERLPSVDNRVEAFLAAGVPRAKLGVGVSFYGYVWNGTDASRPGEGWSSPPGFKNLPYYRLADDFGLREYEYSHPAYHWDDKAQAAYLSIEDGSPGGGKFVSYDNEVAARKKVEYAQRKGLGGVIIWELGGGYRDSQEKGRRDLLLQAVKRAAFGGGGLR
jgi:chitinase